MSAAAPGRVAVLGAGLVGTYLGGRLAAAGVPVTLIGRARLLEAVAGDGLRLSDMTGWSAKMPADGLRLASDPAALADAALVLVTVKSADTAAAADAIAAHAPAQAVVISFQNGVGNVAALQAALVQAVVAGMVPFNVARMDDGRWHQGTDGRLAAASGPAIAPWRDVFAEAGLPLILHPDMAPVQWAKLIVNLNNAVNALSRRTLRQQLAERGYRRALALAQAEALTVLARAGVRLGTIGGRPAKVMPWILRLPDPFYRRVMARAGGIRMDPLARSSMADDLAAGRLTEVDYLNGAVVALAERWGMRAPVNAAMVALVHAAEAGAGPVGPGELLARLKAARRG